MIELSSTLSSDRTLCDQDSKELSHFYPQKENNIIFPQDSEHLPIFYPEKELKMISQKAFFFTLG
jgi:hypothetical protein